jgi:hypothetical protein
MTRSKLGIGLEDWFGGGFCASVCPAAAQTTALLNTHTSPVPVNKNRLCIANCLSLNKPRRA